jgi:hypothetical protein
VLISEISNIDRWEEQISEQVQRLEDAFAHYLSARGMLVLERIL